ncbi:MAG: class I SAM-dependent methyltransferase [Pseudomonadota bacterium]
MEQGPSYLNFVCALNGMEPVPLDRPYTCFELGFGRGLTANVLAAGNPNGKFYAADFNPAHVAGAQAMADAAQLDNLVLLEHNFAELAQGKADLPPFDFITLHGIYTWVNAENRQHIIDFIARYLKPGGIVYISYNCMPGWTAALPLQRLLVEYADAFPHQSETGFTGAAAFLKQLQALDAGYFTQNPSVEQKLDVVGKGDESYLVHEYMHKHWQPMYHADVVRDVAAAKLDFVGSANLPFAFPGLYLNQERQDMLATMPNAALRETIKDYFLNTGFRRDVFVRGARKMSIVRQFECLAQYGLVLMVPRSACTLQMKVSFGKLTGTEELYTPVFDALAQRPHTLAELAALPSLQGHNVGMMAQVAALLTASGQASLYHRDGAQTDPAPGRRLNRYLAAQVRYGDEYRVLATPLAGSGIETDLMMRLVYWILTSQQGQIDLPTLQQQVWQAFHAMGRKVMKGGVVLDGDDENRAELNIKVEELVRDKLPLWRQLKIL